MISLSDKKIYGHVSSKFTDYVFEAWQNFLQLQINITWAQRLRSGHNALETFPTDNKEKKNRNIFNSVIQRYFWVLSDDVTNSTIII